jgi:hypothetical protein
MTAMANFIRDQLVDRLASIEPSPWKTIRKVPMPSLSTDKLPALGVFMIRENMVGLGDANVGPPKFQSDLVLGISITAASNDEESLQAFVDASVETVLNRLLQDYSFTSTLQFPGQPAESPYLIDSFPNIQRTYNFPTGTETYVVECRLQMTIRYWCVYPPETPNWLKMIAVAVQPPPLTTPQETIYFNIPWGNP